MQFFALRGPRAFAILTLLALEATRLEAARTFTVGDDIEMSRFALETTDAGRSAALLSPDGRLLAVVTEKGLVNRNLIEDSIWIWRTAEVRRFLAHAEQVTRPQPNRLLQMGTFKKGPVISQVRWLADSSSILFLGVTHSGNTRLYKASVSTSALDALTPDDEDVVDFDVRNGTFVYAVKSPDILAASTRDSGRPAFMTGKNLIDVVFPLDRYPERAREESNYCDIWAIMGGRRFRVEHNGQKVHLYLWSRHDDPQGVFRLSPNGQFIA